MALHLNTKIDIEAAPEAVWGVLSDLPSVSELEPVRRGTLPGFERMNEAVKERAEAQTARVAA